MKKIFITIICLIFTSLFALELLTEDKLLSETENKKLQQKPEFSIENILSGKYQEEYDEYVSDQFFERDSWISLKTLVDKDIFLKKEINGIYFGKNGALFEKHEEISEKEINDKLNKLTEFMNKYTESGHNVQVMLVPTSDNIYSDEIPNMPIIDEFALFDRVKEAIGEESTIEIGNILKEHKNEYIYYRTDHHWTTEGAYLGYVEFCKKMGLSPTQLNLEEVSDNFLGTLHSRINIPVKPDTIYKMNPETEIKNVIFDMQKQGDGLFYPSYLKTKNKYGYFLDDNHGLIEITTNNENGKTLTIIKDSYANCMIPMLANHYEKINVIDKRYFAVGFENAIPENSDILILYNIPSFFTNF